MNRQTDDIVAATPPPPDAAPESEETLRQRDAFRALVRDNDARLWYITRYNQSSDFDKTCLKTLLEFRECARDPSYIPDTEAELRYRHATMTAARHIGSRRPETIRQFADVQTGARRSPTAFWNRCIFVALALALVFHGYQTLVSRQITAMNTQVANYLRDAPGLLTGAQDVGPLLSSLCQHTLAYRAAADQLSWLVLVLSDPPDATETDQPPGVCAVFTDAVNDDLVLPQFPAAIASDDGALQIAEEELTRYQAETRELRARAMTLRLGTVAARQALARGESIVEALKLFLLPVVFALLGSLAAAVRSANERMKNMTLTKMDGVGLWAKVMLGMVAGATVGIVFTSSEELAATSGLTQLGMAFAVGYTVEIFFNLLDGVSLGLGSNDRREEVAGRPPGVTVPPT